MGAVTHHGRLRSGGVATSPSGAAVLLCGSCWFDDATRLARPADVLERFESGAEHGASPALNGNYALIFHDPNRRILIAESDFFGVYPLYYALDDNGVAVSSEIKHLVGPGSRLDLDGVAETLAFGYIASDATLVAGVKRLPPGARLLVDDRGLRMVPARRPPFSRDRAVNEPFLDELSEAFEGALERYKGDLPAVSVSLSGGLDSRIACLGARRAGLAVTAWTTGEPGSLEARVAAQFGERIGIPVHVHTIQGSAFADWFSRAVWATEGRCPPGHIHYLDGLLTGDFFEGGQLHGLIGDAVIGGDFDLPATMSSRAQAEEESRRRMGSFLYWPPGRKESAVASAVLGREKDASEAAFGLLWRRCPGDDPYSDYLWFRYQFRVFGFTIPCLCSQVLPWMDLLAPYLDKRFFSLGAAVDRTESLERQVQIRWALRRYAEAGLVPRVKDGVIVPLAPFDPTAYSRGIRRIRRRNDFRYAICRLSRGRVNLRYTESFPSFGQWFRRWPPVRQFVESTLLSQASLDRGLWRREGVEDLLGDLRIGRNVWGAVGTMLTIETFARLFLDQTESPSSVLVPSTIKGLVTSRRMVPSSLTETT